MINVIRDRKLNQLLRLCRNNSVHVVYLKCIINPIVELTAVLVGYTQSNISAPKAQQTTISTGWPTPIT